MCPSQVHVVRGAWSKPFRPGLLPEAHSSGPGRGLQGPACAAVATVAAVAVCVRLWRGGRQRRAVPTTIIPVS